MFKFQDDLMVNGFEIVVLLGQIWVYMRKIRVTCEGYFYHCKYYFAIPNGGDVQKWVSSLVLKSHNNPTINKSKIIVLLGQVWVYVRKREGFERQKTKRIWEEGRTYYLFYFLFYYFIKINSILLPIK